MLFNTSNKNYFSPELNMDGVVLEVVKEKKLLGVVITNDIKWQQNILNITNKAYKILQILKRLKQMGGSNTVLINVYTKQVRSIIEYASIVWNSSLTQKNIPSIERNQRSAIAVIFGSRYNSYEEACHKLNMDTLIKRREKLSMKFATKTSNHPTHNQWFVTNQEVSRT